jgi:hypothetical protein
MRAIVLVTALLTILPSAAQAQGVGFLEVQGIDGGVAEIFLTSGHWAEPRRRELATDPVLFELPPGEYSLEVRQEGFRSFSSAVTVISDEVSIVLPLLRPILTEVRIVHLLPAEVPYRLGGLYGVTPATVRVPVGDQVILINDVPFCLRFRATSTAYVRIRTGNVEEIRGATECPLLPLSPLVPPSPRGMIIPPRHEEFRKTEVTVWVFIDERGRVVSDSTRLEPPTSNEGLNRALRREAAEWIFSPARQNGRAVPAWFPYVITDSRGGAIR